MALCVDWQIKLVFAARRFERRFPIAPPAEAWFPSSRRASPAAHTKGRRACAVRAPCNAMQCVQAALFDLLRNAKKKRV